MPLNRLKPIAARFVAAGGSVLDLHPLGRGHINDTYRVTTDVLGSEQFVLQRLNRRVFPEPERLMANIRIVTEHIHRRLQQEPAAAGRGWEVPRVLATTAGSDGWIDSDGSFWRALSFIAAAHSQGTVGDPAQAEQVGFALGRMHRLLSDLDPERLAPTLPGFHDTPRYLRQFDAVVAAATPRPSPELRLAFGAVARGRSGAAVLENAKRRGVLRLRPIHGDPKADNVLVDVVSGRAVAMVDLDTVHSGLIQTDLGDCLRSACNPLGEDPEAWESVRFVPDLARALLIGYLEEARSFVRRTDREIIVDAVRLIAFELGVRFLTDYLAGNVYFKTQYPEHNLLRALVQFQLSASVAAQEAWLRGMVRALP